MAEESNLNNPKILKLEGTTHDGSKLTQIGSITAETVYINTEQKQTIAHLESSTKAELPGFPQVWSPPKSLADWQGREKEIAELQKWLADANNFLIGIEGIGGTGKSMLAAKIYHDFQKIDGLLKPSWNDVSNGKTFTDLARKVLTEFGFRVPEKESQLVDAFVSCLCSGKFLLIIDNLESVLQPDRKWGNLFYSEFFNAWVESGSNSKVLVTTRERPELKRFKWLTLKGLQVDEGVALLTALGITGNLREFVESVDGHPLLLRLVADLLKEEYSQDPDLSRLADLQLGNLQQLLTDTQVKGVHRRENVGMELVLDASFNRLNDLQKALLLNISVYRGTVDGEAAVAVLPENLESEIEINQKNIERELRNLVKRSLLLEKLNGKSQFGFQPVVLEYVRYKAFNAGNLTEAHQRAIKYYFLNSKEEPWQTREDIKEYLEIFYHKFQLEDYDSAFNILSYCFDFLFLQGHYTSVVDLYKQLIEAWEKTGEQDNSNYELALTRLGNAYLSLGQYQEGIKSHEQSLQISIKKGDRDGQGVSLGNLGNAYLNQGNYQRSMELHHQSLQIARDLGNRDGESYALGNLGVACLYQGKYQEAINFFGQSREISQEISDRNSESLSLMNLGSAYFSLGKYHKAVEFHQQSLDIAREIGNRHSEGLALMNLGLAYLYQGQYRLAIKFYEQSLKIAREIGDRNTEGKSLMNLGMAYFYLGQYQQMMEYCQPALEIGREIGDRNIEGKSLANMGLGYIFQQQYQQGIDFCEKALEIAREIGDRYAESLSLSNLGLAYLGQQQYPQAIDFCNQSLNIAREIGDRNTESKSLGNLSAAYLNQGQYQQAIYFCQESLKISGEIGDLYTQSLSLANLGMAYWYEEQYQQAIDSSEESLKIASEIGNLNIQSRSLMNLGLAYLNQEQYQQAIDSFQQFLAISGENGEPQDQAAAWFNLGLALELVNQQENALVAYNKARELYQTMGLEADMEDCNYLIERLLQE